MIATPANAERVQNVVFNFEIYRFLKKRPIYPIPPTRISRGSVILQNDGIL